MDLAAYLRLLKHLLPTGRAWRLTIDKPLRRLFLGLAAAGARLRQEFDLIYLDLFPQTTRELDEWENTFGLIRGALTEPQRRERLAATWQALGGQDPYYIEQTLRAHGFDVYLHEWWDEETGVTRNPLLVLGTGDDMFGVSCGEAEAYCGEEIMLCGYTESPPGYALVNLIERDAPYLVPTDPEYWPYFAYIGGAEYGQPARISPNRRTEFETLCLKICPAHLWLGVIVEYS